MAGSAWTGSGLSGALMVDGVGGDGDWKLKVIM